jgi:hypothetical protein
MWFAFSLETFTHMLVGAMIGIAVIGLIADIQKIGERSSDNDGETAEEPN